MTDFNSGKLSVTYKNSYNKNGPLKDRRYSLSHSDETGDLFLTIGDEFYYKDNQTVLAELFKIPTGYYFKVYVEVDGDHGIQDTVKRDKIFRQHLDLAIKSMIYGDKEFLSNNDFLDIFVVVRFKSRFSKYNVEEQWGRVAKYL